MDKRHKKSAKIPKPIKVKKEKSEESRSLQSMAFYVDDRLELVKQIFGTLKPKTITNLAPEFLKKKKLEKIEELCLTELLCISKKRLLSIINGTKCPTDTESSSDSEVEEQREHVSLEEISSDSNMEADSSKRGKKKKLSGKGNEKPEENKKDEGGVISVLELLELQARARAIRSQLALEPVTKIEVDADDDNAKKSVNSASAANQAKERKTKSSKPRTNGLASSSMQNSTVSTSKDKDKDSTEDLMNKSNELPNATSSVKKVKLKRSYRKNTASESNETEAKTSSEVKQERKSVSPDVIPIVAEPETLCISDSSDDEKDDEVSKKKRKNIGDKSKEESKELSSSVKNKEEKEKSPPKRKESDVEEGELSETEALPNPDPSKEQEQLSEKKSEENAVMEEEPEPEPEDASQREKTDSPDGIASHLEDSSRSEINLEEESNHSENSSDNDDVISIEGSDIETEMTKELEKDSGKTKESDDFRNNSPTFLISGSEDSKDHHDVEESFRDRYLNSSKVTKVLTESRLGKRVRDRIKQSKQNSNNAKKTLQEENPPKVDFQSKHEDGSVEQYKELLGLKPK